MNGAPDLLHNGIYQGLVRHRRFSPKARTFSYKVFMVYLDLQTLDDVFSNSPWWSQKKFSLAWFRRKDYFDGGQKPLYESVRDFVYEQTGQRLSGPIRMLTNLRYFGFIINPITCYYCFDESGKELQTLVAEVTNTPWRQRCLYVLNQDSQGGVKKRKRQVYHFDKAMHVSPFQPMGLDYSLSTRAPRKNLVVHIDVNDSDSSDTVLDATLVLKHRVMDRKNMNRFIFRYPWMTLKVAGAIYWQALKLWLNKFHYFSNPDASKKWTVALKVTKNNSGA